MLYRLSKLVPVPFRTVYQDARGQISASWWQWRGRCFRVRDVLA